jgi:hypothetical protein
MLNREEAFITIDRGIVQLRNKKEIIILDDFLE